ncbi:MAG: bifunctional 2-polyprenyl-6-hydroxyphenol methylase/3-demethylubiquinol 3-O-methyltransferase UbiG [Alphaproteobacteria bacterium]
MPSATPSPAASKLKDAQNFAQLSSEWARGQEGAWGVLAKMNETRLNFIFAAIHRAQLLKTGKKLHALDIGGGGGLVGLPLAETGFHTTILDPALPPKKNRPQHQKLSYLKGELRDLLPPTNSKHKKINPQYHNQKYDLVTCLEVIEHAEDAPAFAASTAQLVRPNGLLILSTINRSWKSWILDIVLAERILKAVPPGTHDWNSFVTPAEVTLALEKVNCTPDNIAGLIPDPLGGWHLSPHRLSCNYIASFRVKK